MKYFFTTIKDQLWCCKISHQRSSNNVTDDQYCEASGAVTRHVVSCRGNPTLTLREVIMQHYWNASYEHRLWSTKTGEQYHNIHELCKYMLPVKWISPRRIQVVANQWDDHKNNRSADTRQYVPEPHRRYFCPTHTSNGCGGTSRWMHAPKHIHQHDGDADCKRTLNPFVNGKGFANQSHYHPDKRRNKKSQYNIARLGQRRSWDFVDENWFHK